MAKRRKGEMTLTEAAALLGISRQSVHEAMTAGKFGKCRQAQVDGLPGHPWLIKRAAVERYGKKRAS